MRRLLLLLLLFPCWGSFAQTVEWTRQFSMGTSISSVTGSVFYSDSTLYSVASVRKWGYNASGSTPSLFGLGLVKTRTSNGDTVFVRRLQGYSSGLAKILKSFEGNFVIAVVSTYDTIFDSKILVQKVDTNGNLLWMLPLNAGLNDPQVIKVLAAPDGGTFILGSDFSTIGGLQDWLLIKVSFSGQLQWSQRYSGGPNWYCEANNIEPLRNGNYLISGMAERQVWSVEVDADGNQMDQHIFYETALPYLMIGGMTSQGYPRSYYSFGVVQSSPRRFYFSRQDTAYQKVWGGEQNNLLGQFYANTSGGYSLLVSGKATTTDSIYLNLIRSDSLVMWRRALPRTGLFPTNAIINDVAFDGNGNVVLCGTADKPASTRDELFFMKISGIGLPYDPFADTVLVGKQARQEKENWKLYPNPSTDRFWVSGLKESVTLQLYAVDGRMVLAQELKPGMPVLVQALPKGLYHCRIVRKEKQQWGRLVKE